MKPITTILCLCFAALSLQAQKSNLLKGKWTYADISDKDVKDSMLLKQAKLFFARTEMEFFPDGKFTYNPLGSNPNSNFSGTWALNKEENALNIELVNPSSGDKKASEWAVLVLTDKTLKLNMGNATVIFGRPKTEKDIWQERVKAELKKKKYVFAGGMTAIGIDDKWGFVDTAGREIIPFKYSYAENLNGGLAKVRTGVYPKYKYGFIDKSGKEIVPVIYDRVGDFSLGLTMVCNNDLYGFVDKTGKVVIPLTYGGTWDFKEGLAMVRNGNWGVGKCGFIDVTGKVVIPLIYEQGDLGFQDGLAMMVLNGKYGYIDKTGKTVVPFTYDFGFSFKEGLAVVNSSKKWGVIDKTGKEITGLKYDNAGKKYDGGLLSVELNDKWGFIDKTGKEVIPLVYDSVGSFQDGKCKVQLNGRTFYINKVGKEVQ